MNNKCICRSINNNSVSCFCSLHLCTEKVMWLQMWYDWSHLSVSSLPLDCFLVIESVYSHQWNLCKTAMFHYSISGHIYYCIIIFILFSFSSHFWRYFLLRVTFHVQFHDWCPLLVFWVIRYYKYNHPDCAFCQLNHHIKSIKCFCKQTELCLPRIRTHEVLRWADGKTVIQLTDLMRHHEQITDYVSLSVCPSW